VPLPFSRLVIILLRNLSIIGEWPCALSTLIEEDIWHSILLIHSLDDNNSTTVNDVCASGLCIGSDCPATQIALNSTNCGCPVDQELVSGLCMTVCPQGQRNVNNTCVAVCSQLSAPENGVIVSCTGDLASCYSSLFFFTEEMCLFSSHAL
jgi:hypothetical protein